MTVPIATSPGRSGFGPQIALTYDSGSSNGAFGFGWSLDLPTITRKTDKGLPRYRDAEDSDVFILSGAEDLVPVLKQNGSKFEDETTVPDYTIHRFRPRVEGLFARIERWTRRSDGDVHWRSISKDNILTLYGKDVDSRVVDPEDPGRIFSWLICETRDDKGNAVLYRYKVENGSGVDLSRVCERNRGDRDDLRRSVNRYPKHILYGNHESLLNNDGQRPRFLSEGQIAQAGWMFEVVFDYGEHDANLPKPDDAGQWSYRDDPFSSYLAGYEVRTTRLCQRVLMFHHFPDEDGVGNDCLVSSTDFSYSHEQDPDSARNPIYTFMNAATQTGYKRLGDGYQNHSLPPVEFGYTQPIVQDLIEEVDPASLENLPIGIDGASYLWADLHGEGIPGILAEQAGAWYYKRNISPIGNRPVELAPLERVASKPNLAMASGAQIMDLAGNGQPDLVAFDGPTPGFYEHDGDESWHSFRPFTSRLNRNTQDPNLKFVDLNGDGHADVLITEDDAFVWHASLKEQGFGPAHRLAQALEEEKGPRIVFADGTQSIYLSDMSGDGLTDLVRIRNDEVCYWPNLGYGRFGAKVSMDQAPHFDHSDQFDHQRIRLADIDGSGTIDIIYLHREGVRLYFNQSGNSWSEAQILNVIPRLDDLVNIVPIDLLGNGTACLVWSSPLPDDARQPMRYVNLMGRQKPHLLVRTTNNLGAETEVNYVPSTQYYLQDKYAGKPWVTRLPFPVHVVEKITVTDKWRKTSFSSTYSYHHGYFDGYEREFRGFGRVEQLDIESFGEFADGNTDSPYISNDKTLYQPPVKTVTWYHTGTALDREHILSQYESEYFPNWLDQDLGGFREDKLPQPDLDPKLLEAEEWREAMRACKGMVLRREVYELDVDMLEQGEHRPVKLFSTAYHNCHIRRLQSREKNPHAVFLVTESEAINYHYELDLRTETLSPDPRITHTLNLQIDEYGNRLQTVAIAYPRIGQHLDNTLPDGAEDVINDVQRERHLAYSETRYSNDVDDSNDFDNYRLRLPCETLTYELTGISPEDADDIVSMDPRDNTYFTLDELRRFQLSPVHQNDGEAVQSIAYHQTPIQTDPQKRLVEHSRMLFFENDLSDALPFGQLDSLGLPYETYTLALTDDLLSRVLGNKFTVEGRANLNDAGKSGYLSETALQARFPNDDTTGQYWIRSGIAGFANDAAAHFYLPERYIDPFGNETTVVFDNAYDLFIESSTDPIGNTVSILQYDYRVLSPGKMQDINGNVSEMLFDTLGKPVATALKGKANEGDNLAGFTGALLDPDISSRSQFFNDAYQELKLREWLDTATTRHLYDFGEQQQPDGSVSYGHRPASAVGILRESHVAQLAPNEESPLQVAIEYSDGMGSVLMQKALAEPETATGPLRWIVNGKTFLNNKGNPVKQYEPYFTGSHKFEESLEIGVTAVMYYDAVNRLVRTELPDGSFSRVAFSPWHITSYDPNDTVLETGNRWYAENTSGAASTEQQRAAQLTAAHADTPATLILDSLGREVVSIEHNRFTDQDQILHDEKYITLSKLDTEGKPLWIRDDRSNLVMQFIAPLKPTRAADEIDPANPEQIPAGTVPCYDIAGNLLFKHSMDSGDRWTINDAAGQEFYAWDLNERAQTDATLVPEHRQFYTSYDALRRPLQQRMQVNDGPWQVIERIVYGESHPDAHDRNLRGRAHQAYDSGGLISNQRFDFKGNLLQVQRQLASAYDAAAIHWPETPPVAALEQDVYTRNTEYDALNRMLRQENWHLDNRAPAIYAPKYNQRGLLSSETLSVRGQVTQAITNIEYDAKGQRRLIQLGNGSTTRYHYDAETFRLLQLRTTRDSPGDVLPTAPSNLSDPNVLQNIYYTYDPVGNICEVRDDAYEPVFFNNQQVEARNRYNYDALYRLIEASGRENHQSQSMPKQFEKAPFMVNFPVTDQALRNYSQFYSYDSVGNIVRMRHMATGGNWTRHYAYFDDSNRLLQTWQGNDTSNAVVHDYDGHGNMHNLNRSPEEYRLRWNYDDMIDYVNLGGGGQVFYSYASDKQRTRKRIERNGNTIEERLYLGGMERYRRWNSNNLVEEIETHHLFTDARRVLLVEDVLSTDNSNLEVGAFHRYQYGNHLSSVGLELDSDASIISYEEYHPYGTTAYRAVNAAVKAVAKRYRYSGMERDDESGLNYHGARYYTCWLGRWVSADPAGMVDGTNLYASMRGSPVVLEDRNGEQSDPLAEEVGAVHYVNKDPVSAGKTPTFAISDEPITIEDQDQPKKITKQILPPRPPPTVEQLSDKLDALDAETREKLNAPGPNVPQGEQESSLFDEVIQGDFYEGEPSVLGTIVGIGIGFTPIGIALDIRDSLSLIDKAARGEEVSGWDVAASAAGFLPFGDMVKGLRKGKKAVDAAEGLGEKMIKAEKKSGLNVDVAAQPHHKKTEFRKGSGKKVQSAHMVPSVAVRNLQNYSRSKALTVLLPKKLHRAFDKAWMKEARKLRRKGITEITVQQWEMMLVDAANSVKGLKGRTADTMAFMIRTEFYQTLGLSPLAKLPLPKLK